MLTIFIVHGWDQNENYTWLHDTKDAFLDEVSSRSSSNSIWIDRTAAAAAAI